MSSETRYSFLQQLTLVTLRTLIGWHFLYEGIYKLMLPGWGSDGRPLPPWTSAGFLKGASGPLAGLFQRLVDAGWTSWIDGAVKVSLILIGVSLILGVFTRTGTVAALVLLSLFYLLSIPLSGGPQPGSEGTYLIVNKTLIEGVACLVLLAFDTGKIAGLDLFLADRQRHRALKQSQGLAKQPTVTDTPVSEAAVHDSGRPEPAVAQTEKPITEELKKPDFPE